jgi:subtilisin family serine protease
MENRNNSKGIGQVFYPSSIRASGEWPYTGKGVVTAVLDSGINFGHQGLAHHTAGQNFARSASGTIDTVKIQDIFQGFGHGTAMAGIIAAQMPEWSGVAPDAHLIGLNLFEAGKGNKMDDALFEAMVDVAIQQKAKVMNISLVFPGDSSGRKTAALNRLIKSGCLVCCAAGNEPLKPGQSLGFPANLTHEGIVVVGACRMDGQLFKESPHDENINLFVKVQSIVTLGTKPNETFTFSLEDSTSAATALVSGLAALLIEANQLLTPKHLSHILRNTGELLPTLSTTPKSAWGKRYLDAPAAIQLAENYHRIAK